MPLKFKIGDIIRIANRKDPAYKNNSLYVVAGYSSEFDHYDLTSVKGKYTNNVVKILEPYAKMNPFAATMIDRKDFDKHYRLATKAEILLYGPKI